MDMAIGVDFENPMSMDMGMRMTFENGFGCGYSYTHPSPIPNPYYAIIIPEASFNFQCANYYKRALEK